MNDIEEYFDNYQEKKFYAHGYILSNSVIVQLETAL